MLMRLKIEQGAIGVWEWQGGAQTPARVKSLIPLPLCPSCELERIECKHFLSSKCHFEEKVAEMGRRRPARIGAKSCRSCSPIDFFGPKKPIFRGKWNGGSTAVRFPTRWRGYEKEFCTEFTAPQAPLPMHPSIAPDTRNPFGARPPRARFTSENLRSSMR